MTNRASTHVAGEELTLLAERAAFWSRARTLLVADPHFGKAAAFRAAAVPAPRGTTGDALRRLDIIIDELRAERILFLGDFLHAREGRAPATLETLNRWRRRRADVEMVLVRGNHDRRAGDPPAELSIECVDGPLIEAPFAFAHHPAAVHGAYVLAGHIHPGVRLSGSARDHVRLPCFWFGEAVGVLPAFGDFTGLADIEPELADDVWVIAETSVLRVESRGLGGRDGL